MGEIADLIMEGVICAECSAVIDDEKEGFDGPCGYPRYCGECGGRIELNGQKPAPRRRKKKRRK